MSVDDNNDGRKGEEPDAPSGTEHETLKYHLLGPSLTKSGQTGVDQKKVSETIYNASKGSKFFNHELNKDRDLTEKIGRILAQKQKLDRLDLSADLRRADSLIAELELGRDLTQTVIHIDCDAFYAAVEELDRPELKNVPFAVGVGVLTTCNYHARKFGCRSGMAGFVAKQLCPDLICLPMNFEKYTAKAEEVRAVLAEYDPNFESASVDEAYLNITEYCKARDMSPEDVVAQLRTEVHERTRVTVSAGIAANAKLAKICSNINKPNGQYLLPSDRDSIMRFMRDLPTRKVNGIGRVFERELAAIGINTVGDIYEHRALLPRLFGEKASTFLLQCYLGLGRTKIQPPDESERKSVGTETTFRDLGGKAELRQKLMEVAEELEKDLERTKYKGRTLVLKVKLHTYEVLTRQTSPPMAVNKKDQLYKYALPMLAKLEKEIPGLKLRLMGLRVTQLVSTKPIGIDFFGLNKRTASSTSGEARAPKSEEDAGTWQTWPESEFEEAARRERQAEMNELEALSQEQEESKVEEKGLLESNPPSKSATPVTPEIAPLPPSATTAKPSGPLHEAQDYWDCPICARPQPADDGAFNSHIDSCLSRQTIKEVVKDISLSSSSAPPAPTVKSNNPSVRESSRKRKVGGNHNGHRDDGDAKRRMFFLPAAKK